MLLIFYELITTLLIVSLIQYTTPIHTNISVRTIYPHIDAVHDDDHPLKMLFCVDGGHFGISKP